VVDDEAISEVLASRRTQVEQCDLLIDLALANASQDNATAVVVNYHVPELQAGSA
jgi:serine/threonine protein phosphatase PrpC